MSSCRFNIYFTFITMNMCWQLDSIIYVFAKQRTIRCSKSLMLREINYDIFCFNDQNFCHNHLFEVYTWHWVHDKRCTWQLTLKRYFVHLVAHFIAHNMILRSNVFVFCLQHSYKLFFASISTTISETDMCKTCKKWTKPGFSWEFSGEVGRSRVAVSRRKGEGGGGSQTACLA